MSQGLKVFLIIAIVLLIWRSPDLLDSVVNLVDKLITTPPK